MKKTYPRSMIYRTKILEGKTVYSFICNGGYYALIDLPVYEDGVIDCWEEVDLDELMLKIDQGWLTPQVPKNDQFSIHHLATLEIKEASWLFNKNNYYEFIVSVVQSMNPTMNNLYKLQGDSSKMIGNTNYSKYSFSAKNLVRQDASSPSFKEFKGEKEHFFFKTSELEYYLISLSIFNDGKILVEAEVTHLNLT